MTFDRAELGADIIARFERVARTFPDHIAIDGNGRQLTYAVLERFVRRTAAAIASSAIAGSGCVAILLDHSPEMVACALAVMKAGRAYLCLHPRLPLAAQQEIVRDASPELILSSAAHAVTARNLADRLPVMALEEIEDGADLDAASLPHLRSSDPAAIFYTSGSTGRPKGIVKSHRAILHRAWLAARYDNIQPIDRQSLLTFCSFASSEADMFGTLLNGAAVHLLDAGSVGLGEFGDWIDAHQITVLHPPVVLFRRYLATLDGENAHPSVRLVALAGETVLASDLAQWRRRFHAACALRHRFSSTEAGHIAVGCIEPGQEIGTNPVPPAFPVSDKQLAIVDEQGNPVAQGESGELLVRSEFLSDGYWRRPGESAADFPSDSAHPALRRFRTGDLGRILADGSFEFQGRRDDQIKIRGYRVEIREVERAIVGCPQVSEATVIADRRGDETRLISFAVPRAAATVQPEEILRELRRLLPAWKVPAQLHLVDSLPLTLTGKIDRRQLAERLERTDPKPPTAAQVRTNVDSAADPVEARLTTLWTELFGRSEIRPTDNFFDLGGHSLLAAQMVHRIQRRFGRSLPMSILIERPTIRQLACAIASTADTSAATQKTVPSLIPLRKSGVGPPLIFVPLVDSTGLTYMPLVNRLTADRPVHALLFPDQPLDVPDDTSVETLAARFVEFLLQTLDGPYLLCGHSYGGVLAYEMARQLAEAGHSIGLLALLDSRRPGSRKLLPPRPPTPSLLQRVVAMGPGAAAAAALRRVRRRLAPVVAPESDAYPPEPTLPLHVHRTQVFRAYRAQPYGGEITLFRSTVPSRPSGFEPPGPMNGWDDVCSRISVHHVPGNHHSILRDPNLRVLAAAISSCLDRVGKTV